MIAAGNRAGAASGNRIPSAGIPLAPRDGRPFPLSFSQQRLWFFEQLERGSAVYNVPISVRVSGPLDLDAFRAAVNEIVRRHEVLRTRLAAADGVPVQIVETEIGNLAVPLIDLSRLGDSSREQEALRLASEEALRPFDVSRAPLLRAQLLKLAGDDHVVLLTLHHIVHDGWSTGVLLGEIAALYGAFTRGQPSPLPDLPIQYADFAVWQRERLNGAALNRDVAWWKRRLEGCSPLQLPSDRPRHAQQRFRGATEEGALPAALHAALADLSRREGCSLFMTLLAAFQVLLARYSGQADIAVGCPIAGRTRAETRGMIGCFLNTLVFRANLTGNPSFQDFLRQARALALEAYAHQDAPFEKVVEALQPDRTRSYAPLFQVMFTLDNTPAHPFELPGLAAAPFGPGKATAGADWDLTVIETAHNGLRVLLEYDTDRFDRTSIARALENWRALLENIVLRPAARIGEIPLLTGKARRELLLCGQGPQAGTQDEAPVTRWFEAVAAERPDSIAAVCGDRHITYGELNRRSNQLARVLQNAGVRTEQRAGLLLERNLDFAIAVLAVWKAGAAYVPLDPAYPPERLRWLLEDAHLSVLLLPGAAEQVARDFPVTTLSLDALRPQLAKHAGANLDTAPDDGDLAYVIYTSGSTGRPKGVMIEHRGLRNHLLAKIGALGLTAADVAAQTASSSFDISVWQLIAPLLAGGTARMVPDVVARDARALADDVERSGVSVLEVVPGMLAVWGAARPFATLRWMISTGEALPAAVARAWTAGQPGIPLLNAYGPTECSDDVTHFEVSRDSFSCAHAPLGRPLRNLQLYVVDAHGELAPQGVPGELYVGGAGVGRGYFARPALTAERFVPDSFSAAPGARLYRTGDRVRWLNRDLEYLGRIDQQVKIRGHRIELGEIEAVLAEHPAVRQSAVAAWDGPLDGKRLVAYISIEESGGGLEAIEVHARRRLPGYMVPSAFLALAEFPVTPNGKLDRASLPAPDWNASAGGRVAPRTPIEEIVAGVWSQVLCLDSVGVEDSFFELGGHSLLATQVMSRLGALLNLDLPLRILFDSPTVAGLAAHIEQSAKTRENLPPILPAGRDDAPLPLSYAQQRLWLIDQIAPGNPAYNIHTSLHLVGEFDAEAARAAWSEIVRRNSALRTRFLTRDGQPVQMVPREWSLDFTVESLFDIPAAGRLERARELSRQQALQPFALDSGTLLRVRLLQLGAQEHALLVTFHHIAGDGWSVAILVREFSSLYRAFAAGQASPLPEPAIQYVDYAVWQRGWLNRTAWEPQLAYWKRQLAGSLPVLRLPSLAGAGAGDIRGAAESFTIPAPAATRLRELARAEGATLFMLLLAAYQVLLARYSGESDILVGCDVANRNRLETEPLVGFFVNQLALRAQVDGKIPFRDFLRQVRGATLDAYANQDLPFEKLVEELAPARGAGHSPLFQTKLILEKAGGLDPHLPGVSARRLEIEPGAAKLDLLMNVVEHAEQLTGSIEYRRGLYGAALIRNLARHWQVLLEAIAQTPETRIEDVPLLEPAEREQALRDWNATEADYGRATAAAQIAEQGRRNRDRVAVEYEGSLLTYGELNRRANRLGRYLRGLGVGPEVRVAVCLERGLDLVVALLGVWKAGGAYVPLDVGYPLERLGWMLEDCGAPVVVTEERLREKLPSQWAQVVSMDGDRERLEEESGEELEEGGWEEALAYVIYTSGSTGEPKGVMVSHAALANYLNWGREAYNLANAWAPLHTSLSFDLTVTSLWGPLASGGAVVLCPERDGIDGLQSVLKREPGRGAVVKLTPAHLQALLPGPDITKSIGAFVIGGEALHFETLRAWRERAPSIRLINEYGPTETVVGCAVHIVAPVEEGVDVPIGRPIANTSLFVLDEAMQPVPAGVAGELYIGGRGVARGYWRRPDLTAARFVPNPFAPEADGSRLYRTGDRVRYRLSGVLEYIGRTDRQVKLRGYRIETAEIEAALNRIPGIRASAVLCREDRPGDKRLVAYLARAGVAPGAAEARSILERTLPAYMLPAAYVFLDSLPLTPNGKLDRKALPAPDAPPADLRPPRIAPRTIAEEILAGIWRETLGVDDLGVLDNFFDLGGHSLTATQMISRVRDAFRIEVPLSALFSHPTIEGLACALADVSGAETFRAICEALEEIRDLSDTEVEAALAQWKA